MRRKTKFTSGWGGFREGKLDWDEVDMGWGGFGEGDRVIVPAIFKSRARAKERYQDFRRIEIRETKAKRP